MNKTAIFLILFTAFSISNPKTALASFLWIEGSCSFQCNNSVSGGGNCQGGTVLEDGVCEGNLPLAGCYQAAVDTCGLTNFSIDWYNPNALLEKYDVKTVQTTDGQTLNGDAALQYLQKRFPLQTEAKPTTQR